MDSGADCYRRYLDGDNDAFDEILDLYRERLIYFINRLVDDLPAAEDLAIDTFMELIVHKHRYNFKTPLKTYLFTIGRNRALNFLKHRSKLRIVALDDAENEAADCADLEERVLSDERKRAVNTALEKLPEDMRTVVHLIYFEDLTYDDAARIMNKSRKQVDNLLYRAKNALRAAVGKEAGLL